MDMTPRCDVEARNMPWFYDMCESEMLSSLKGAIGLEVSVRMAPVCLLANFLN